MNFLTSNISSYFLVCDNVHRTLSRYLHIQKHTPQKLGDLGQTLEDFDEKLATAGADFRDFLNDIKRDEGFGTMEGILFYRFISSFFHFLCKNDKKCIYYSKVWSKRCHSE